MLPAAGRGEKNSRDPLDNAETNGIPIAQTLPVARVVLDLQPAHLDQPYDYLVPATMADDAQPGVRSRRGSGGRTSRLRRRAPGDVGPRRPARAAAAGGVRRAGADAAGARAVRAVADRYAGTLADVLRLALPPRHARVEKEPVPETEVMPAQDDTPAQADVVTQDDTATRDGRPQRPALAPPSSAWVPYRGGEAYLRRILAGEAPRAVWSALPGVGVDAATGTGTPHWAAAVAQAVRACRRAGVGCSSSCRTRGTWRV